MRKTALLLAFLMVLGSAPAWCLSGTAIVDHTIDQTKQSEFRPIEDTGKILGLTREGSSKTYHAVTDPMKPVLDPIRRVRDEIVKGTKKVVNPLWDMLTLRPLREKK